MSAAVTLGLYGNYAEAWRAVRDASGDQVYQPDPETVRFYEGYKERTEKLYRASL